MREATCPLGTHMTLIVAVQAAMLDLGTREYHREGRLLVGAARELHSTNDNHNIKFCFNIPFYSCSHHLPSHSFVSMYVFSSERVKSVLHKTVFLTYINVMSNPFSYFSLRTVFEIHPHMLHPLLLQHNTSLCISRTSYHSAPQ